MSPRRTRDKAMDIEAIADPEEVGVQATHQKRTREVGTIAFPYSDLDDGIGVASALLRAGGVPCEPDQLAVAMNHTPSSGTFRQKIATARMFGLIETVQNRYQLTQLGFAITDANRQKAARADAFLNVPLYRMVYDTFRNQQLPPRPVALERSFVGFGVPQKQANRARVAFDSSAQQAGFFQGGNRDRLIRPPLGSAIANGAAVSQDQPIPDTPPPLQFPDNGGAGGGGGGGGGGGYHPFVMGLLDTLPSPGTVWTMEGRIAWLEAAASAFKLMYKGDGKITISVADGQKR